MVRRDRSPDNERVHRHVRIVAVLAWALVVIGSGVSTPFAAEPVAEDRARAIFHEHMSPFCPGLLLSDCSSRPAETLRTDIRAALANGASEAEVKADLQRRFGERILAAPTRQGFGLLAWLVPPVAVIGALIAVVLWWSRRSRTRMPASARPILPVDPMLRARLDAELARF